jgi:dihydrofolate reductase
MRVSVFVGATIDGFLARPDGGIDYLDPFTADNGYAEFTSTVDCLVMGRETYEFVLKFGGAWPYKGKRFVVLSHRPIAPKNGEELHEGPLRPLFEKLARENVKHVYLDGGKAIRQALDEDLVDDMTITTVPRTLGAGRPLFGGEHRLRSWTVTKVKPLAQGMVQCCYQRDRTAVEGTSP